MDMNLFFFLNSKKSHLPGISHTNHRKHKLPGSSFQCLLISPSWFDHREERGAKGLHRKTFSFTEVDRKLNLVHIIGGLSVSKYLQLN